MIDSCRKPLPWLRGLVLGLLGLVLLTGEVNASERLQTSATKGSGGEAEPAPILIGLDADVSKAGAQGGESIRRGLMLAIEEINESGGVLDRPLQLVVKDHRGNPARGIDNVNDFARMEDLVAVVGGAHTPVALAELETIHRHEIIYLGPWAAGTPIVANGYDPNYVFRVSVRDEYAGGFLVDAARQRGFSRLGLLLWRTGWGRSNEKAMKDALAAIGAQPAAVEWFNSGQEDMSEEIDALVAAGADVIMLIANPLDGLVALREVARRPEGERLPILSHWGISVGNFFELGADAIATVDLTFLQTYSFFAPPFPEKAEKLYRRYCASFGGCRSRADIRSPVGTAHAYDIIHILKRAIEQAGTIDRPAVRRSLEQLGAYRGLVRVYDPPFSSTRHDALDRSDFRLSRYDSNGAIVPVDPQ